MSTSPITPESIRAFTSARQCLDGSLDGASPASVLERAGWMRTVGGVGPYLGLHARAGLSREAVDAALAKNEVCELPAVRGCTYLVPASDFAIALRAGQDFGDDARVREAKKYCGVTDAEMDRLCAAVLDALDRAPADPRELKDRLGDAVRHLGEAGKKRGITTTLPVAIGRLQSLGEIRRVPTNGRLDQQRYQYTRWRPSPLSKPLSDEELHRALATRFFRQATPATPAQFAWWSGLGVRAAKQAAASLDLVPLDDGDERLIFPGDREALKNAPASAKARPSFVGSIDNLFHMRREVATSLDAGDGTRKVRGEKKIEPLNSLADLPNHAIVDGGRLIGLWEFDFDAKKIVHALFGKAPAGFKEALARAEAFVRDQLGDARSFSLDSPESRGDRIAALKG